MKSGFFFIYAVASDTPEGHWCRSILSQIMEGEFIACTSTLNWDEIVYVLMKKINRDIALECSEYFLSLPNIRYIDVSPEILKSAHLIMTQYAMKPKGCNTYSLYVPSGDRHDNH